MWQKVPPVIATSPSQQTLRWLANPNEKSAMKHDSIPRSHDLPVIITKTIPASIRREGRRS